MGTLKKQPNAFQIPDWLAPLRRSEQSTYLLFNSALILNQMTTPHIFQIKTRLFSAATAPELLYWVNNLLESGETYLLLNMQEVLFMDSSGLGALVVAHNRVQKAGGRLVMCSLNGQARMLFELAGMEKLFEVYSDQKSFEQALSISDNKL